MDLLLDTGASWTLQDNGFFYLLRWNNAKPDLQHLSLDGNVCKYAQLNRKTHKNTKNCAIKMP